MKTYLVSYDLMKPGQAYSSLYAAIKALPWAHALNSVWLVKASMTSTQLFDHLWAHMDVNDKLLVIAVSTSDWTSINLPSAVVTWLKAAA